MPELHLTEGRLRRTLLRFVSPRVSEEIVAELVERPVDQQDLRMTDEERTRIEDKMRNWRSGGRRR